MMHDAQRDLSSGPDDRTDGFRVEALGLRRKLAFWRRAAWLLLGVLVLVSVLAWQRMAIRHRECRQAFEQYAGQVEAMFPSHAPAEVLESQWRQLDQGATNIFPQHYALVPRNWRRTPGENESLPMAVCRESHLSITGRGRHVLFCGEDGLYIEWLTEDEVASIVAQTLDDSP